MVFSKAMLVWLENVRVFCICHQLASENVLKDFAGHAGQADGSMDSCNILFTFWNESLYRLSLYSSWVEPHLLHFLYSLLFILINLWSFLSIHGRKSLHFVRHLRMKVSMALVISCFFAPERIRSRIIFLFDASHAWTQILNHTWPVSSIVHPNPSPRLLAVVQMYSQFHKYPVVTYAWYYLHTVFLVREICGYWVYSIRSCSWL